MPPFYEDAAHLLLFLTRAGLIIRHGVDCRTVLLRLAALMHASLRDARVLTHHGAALRCLDDLEKRKLVSCDRRHRAKVTAILGTSIANLQASRTATR